jgi:hypothetical protein
MKPYLAMVLGLVSLLLPLWFLSGFVVVPEYRTGTFADFAAPLISGATLYGGVFLGVLVRWRFKLPRTNFSGTFFAGVVGAIAAITLALIASALLQLVSTGRIMPAGQTPALVPVLYIIGGLVSGFIAAGAGLIAYGLGTLKGQR